MPVVVRIAIVVPIIVPAAMISAKPQVLAFILPRVPTMFVVPIPVAIADNVVVKSH